mmetsp:Transcript_10906/g.40360  ORF Transcript_10906/g.40360 Transcript_10906/m.40360 type:complete len:231 (+) Transcript_10906:1163-1855(+)
MACVSPRVNSDEPCTRGSNPPSHVIGRTVFVSRPSCRRLRTRIESRIAWLSILPHAKRTSEALYVSFSASMAMFRTFSTAAPLSCFGPMAIAVASSFPTALATASSTPSGLISILSIFFSRPTSSAHAPIARHALAAASCPFSMAYSISSTVRKSPNPSIIITASSVPARTRSSRDVFICSQVGLISGSFAPGSHPTRTPATGLVSGTSEIAATADAAVIASASVDRTPS